MNEQSLTVIEPAGQLDLRGDPEVVIEQASRAANALMRVVESRKKKLVVGGKQYLFFEDWQTLGQFYSYSVNTLDAEPVEVNGIPGARARAEVIDFRTGLVVGGAEAFCMSSEEQWAGKPWFQLSSMAQTRAASKALRGRLGWVAVLAGYEATPAEEMTGNEHGHAEKPKEHFCDKHGIAFRRFEKNGNVWYSHKDGEGWCNEGKAREAAPEVPKGDGKTEAPKAKAEQGPPDDVPPPYAEPRPANQDNLPGIAPADRATPQQLTAIYAAARNLSIATLNLEADVAAKFHCQIKELSSDQANSYIDQLNSQ